MEASKETNSVLTQQKCSLILNFSKNLDNYFVLDWTVGDRQWVIETFEFYLENDKISFSQFVQIVTGLLFYFQLIRASSAVSKAH